MHHLLMKMSQFPPIGIQTVHNFATRKHYCLKANDITHGRSILYITFQMFQVIVIKPLTIAYNYHIWVYTSHVLLQFLANFVILFLIQGYLNLSNVLLTLMETS